MTSPVTVFDKRLFKANVTGTLTLPVFLCVYFYQSYFSMHKRQRKNVYIFCPGIRKAARFVFTFVKKYNTMTKKKGSTQDRALLTVAIRPTEKKQVDLLEALVKSTGEKSYSGALMNAGSQYLTQLKRIESQSIQIDQLNKQINEANRILNLISTGQQNLAGYSKKFLSGKHLQSTLFDEDDD